ncbi:hypothetical protein [Carboxylicivirga sp. N1Y90]|uniref:hypothetical protein n=1 Tax=Carboxylicivirga fragile TaxID=3417571 RepID=UPI003D340983|nr:hypothetical protein [Marinilabiliaceae bacterium N1Y90]
MKRFFLTLLSFALFSIVCYLSLLVIWAQFEPEKLKTNFNYRIGSFGHTYTRLKEVKTVSDVDILFLGSSHAYRGFDTRNFEANGYKTFNLGTSAQTPMQTKILLNKYLDQLGPKLVILEVYPEIMTIDGMESFLDIISNDEVNFEILKLSLKVNHTKVYNTLFYSVISDFFGIHDNHIEPKVKGIDIYINGGYVETKLNKQFVGDSIGSKELIFLDEQLEAFEDIIQLINNNGSELLLVFAPVSSVLYDSYVNVDIFNDLMTSHGNYYNFNKNINIEDSIHFFDDNHLNQKGVNIFNEELIKLINQTNLLNKIISDI